jgi:hypothetical protein
MRSRGQESFVNMPGFGARFYDTLTRTNAIERQHGDIARILVAGIDHGRLLDIGTGPVGVSLWDVPGLQRTRCTEGREGQSQRRGIGAKNHGACVPEEAIEDDLPYQRNHRHHHRYPLCPQPHHGKSDPEEIASWLEIKLSKVP